MSSLLYIDATNIPHVIPNVKLGSLTGFEGSTGTIETISNADYTAVLKTRISRKERIISLTIPVRGTSADDLEAKESAYLTMFAQTDAPGILRYTRNDGTARETAVYIADGYPVRTAETNTFSWIDVKFVACSPYWTDTAETAITHNTAFENDGDYPAECRLTLNVTVKQITLDGDVIMKFRNDGMMMTHYVTITDNAVTATDTSGNTTRHLRLSAKFSATPPGSALMLFTKLVYITRKQIFIYNMTESNQLYDPSTIPAEHYLIREISELFVEYIVETLAHNQTIENEFHEMMLQNNGKENLHEWIQSKIHNEVFLTEVVNESFRILHTRYVGNCNLFREKREQDALRNHQIMAEK